MERVDTISEVRTKELNDGRTLYLIHDSQGTEYSTTKRELARVAFQARDSGSSVHLDFVRKTNDRGFTNQYLNEISEIPDSAARGNEPDRQPPGLFDSAEPEPRANPQAEKDLAIARAVALKAAVDTMPLLPESERSVSNIVTAAEFYTDWLMTYRPGPKEPEF